LLLGAAAAAGEASRLIALAMRLATEEPPVAGTDGFLATVRLAAGFLAAAGLAAGLALAAFTALFFTGFLAAGLATDLALVAAGWRGAALAAALAGTFVDAERER
jgi:hypothetical protein